MHPASLRGLDTRRPAPPVGVAARHRVRTLARFVHVRHRWAHHPLCAPYRAETLRVGRLVLCRGCTFVVAGAASGLVPGAGFAPAALVTLGVLLLSVAAPAASFALAARGPKLATRFVPGAAIGLALGALARTPTLASAAVAGLACALACGLALASKARTPDRSPCAACPENPRRPDCAGFRPVLRRERAFSRLAGRILERGG